MIKDVIITYEEFAKHLKAGMKTDDIFLFHLQKAIHDPKRYVSLFHPLSGRTKFLIRLKKDEEKRFMTSISKIIMTYLTRLGFHDHKKDLSRPDDQKELENDLLISGKDGVLHLISIKTIDDQTIRQGEKEFQRLLKKKRLVRQLCPTLPFKTILWFLEDDLLKRKDHYQKLIEENKKEGDLSVIYGKKLFWDLGGDSGLEAFEELTEHLERFHEDKEKEDPAVEDLLFDLRLHEALLKLNEKDWTALHAPRPLLSRLRQEFFPAGLLLLRAERTRALSKSVAGSAI